MQLRPGDILPKDEPGEDLAIVRHLLPNEDVCNATEGGNIADVHSIREMMASSMVPGVADERAANEVQRFVPKMVDCTLGQLLRERSKAATVFDMIPWVI